MAGIEDIMGIWSFDMSGWAGMIRNLLYGIGIILVLGVVSFFIYKTIINRKVFIYKIRLITLLDNGVKKEDNSILGGEVDIKGVRDFCFKKGNRKIYLGFLPDYSFMDGDNRLVFRKVGDGKQFQQIKEEIITAEEVIYKNEKGEEIGRNIRSLIIKPIPSNVKNATLNNLRSWRELLDGKKITMFTIGISIFLIMAIAHLVSLYIQTKIKCGLP